MRLSLRHAKRAIALLAVIACVLFILERPPGTQGSGLSVPDYAVAVGADTPRGYWRLGESTNQLPAADSSGNGLTGAYGAKVTVGEYVGAPLYEEDLAANFIGAENYFVGDDYVSMGSPAGLNFGASDFTVEAWVSTEINADRPIVGKTSGAGARWQIVVTDDPGKEGRVRAYIYDGAPTPNDTTAYGPSLRVDDGEFHHVVAVFDREVGTTVYVDRVAAQTLVPMTGNVSNSAPFRIGGTANGASFNGEIDEVAVYPFALSSGQVRAHYDAGMDPPRAYVEETLQDAPVGYWRLGDTVTPSGPAQDSSSGGLTGTFGSSQSSRSPGALVGDSNNAVAFTGIDGVAMGDPPALDFGTSDFSVEAWVKTSVNQERAIIGKVETASLPHWVVSVTDDAGFAGLVRAKVFDGGATLVAYGPSVRVDNGQWHHVLVAADRDLGVTISVDGVERFTNGTTAGNISNNGAFKIGQAADYGAFSGDIDEAAVYDGVLDTYRVAVHHQGGANPSERVLQLEEPNLADDPPAGPRPDPLLPAGPPIDPHTFRPRNRAAYDAAKASAWEQYLQWSGAPEPDPTIDEPVGLAMERNGTGVELSGVDPPDATISVGRVYVVQMVNRQIAVYRKSNLNLIDTMGTASFIRPCVGGLNFAVDDPQIIWDNETKRWFYIATLTHTDDPNQNCLVYGWSKGANPSNLSTGWCHRHTVVTHTWDDYPHLGDNKDWMVVGTNVFETNRAGDSMFSMMYAFRKPSLGPVRCSGPWPTWTPSNPLYPPYEEDPPFSPIPSIANGGKEHAEAYVVGGEYIGSKIYAWRVHEVNGVPRFTPRLEINVGNWSAPPADAPQLGGAHLLDTLDGRFTQAIARRDRTLSGNPHPITVWTQHTVGGLRGRARVRWYQLIPAQRSVRQWHDVVKENHFVYNAAISPAWNGTDVMLQYNLSSETRHVQVFARARTGSTPLGGIGGEVHVFTSCCAYEDVQDSQCEAGACDWGDYSAAVSDPKRARWIWGTNQVVREPDGILEPWSTRIFAGRVSG